MKEKVRKIIRIFLKLTLTLFCIWLVVLAIASLYIHLNREKLVSRINQMMDKVTPGKGNFNAKDVDISVWRYFPSVGVQIKNLSYVDTVYKKPLFRAGLISVQVSVFDLAGTDKEIKKIYLKDAEFNLFTDSTGYTNGYLLKPKVPQKVDSTSGGDGGTVLVQRIELENFRVSIRDALKRKQFDFHIRDLDAGLTPSGNIWQIKAEENILVGGLGFNMNNGQFLHNKTVEGIMNLEFDKAGKKLQLKPSQLKIDGQPFDLEADFRFLETLVFNLRARTKGINYKKATTFLSPNIQAKTAIGALNQPLDVDARLMVPSVNDREVKIHVDWSTSKNEIALPMLTFTNAAFTGCYDNEVTKGRPRNDSNSRLTFRQLAFEYNGIKMHTDSLIINNLTTPTISFRVLGNCTAAELEKNFQSEAIKFRSGSANLNIFYDGPLLANLEFLKRVSVDLDIHDVGMQYVPKQIDLSNCHGRVIVGYDSLRIDSLNFMVGKSRFHIDGHGRNLSSIGLGDGDAANVIFNVSSPSINLRDYLSLLDENEAAANKELSGRRQQQKAQGSGNIFSTADNLLQNGTIALNLHVGEIIYNRFNGKNVQALAMLGNDWFKIKKASIQHAGGILSLTASLDKKGAQHKATASASMSNVDVKQVFYAFDNFGQSGITYKNLNGRLNCKADVQTLISPKGTVIPRSTFGTVDFSIKNGALLNYEPISKVQDVAFKNRDFDHIYFAEIKDKIAIKGNEIWIPKLEIQSTVLSLFVEGIYDLAGKNTDFTIQVPISNIFKRDKDYKPKLKGSGGASIYVRARTDDNGQLKFGLDVFNKLRKKKTITIEESRKPQETKKE
jgi:hypothetical protein